MHLLRTQWRVVRCEINKMNIPLIATRCHATAAILHKTPKTGVLFLNMGSPSENYGVKPFLESLFRDEDIFKIPAQKTLASIISAIRAKSMDAVYASMNGKGDVVKWSKLQGDRIISRLNDISPEISPYRAYYAFRYSPPFTEEALNEIEKDRIERCVILSLYPQYSCSTTGSSLNELYKKMRNRKFINDIKWHFIDRWPITSGFIDTFAENTSKCLSTLPLEERSKALILFSAHSLPLNYVSRGDQYPLEVASSVTAVMQKLNYSNPYSIAWQSKFGKAAWLEPSLLDSVKGYKERSIDTVVVVPISFISDHIETLVELDRDCKEFASKLGLKRFLRVEPPNGSVVFTNGLAQLIHDSIHYKVKTHSDMKIICPKCIKSSCSNRVNFFSKITSAPT